MAREASLLRRVAPEVDDGLPRLRVRIALCVAALCLPHGLRDLKGASVRLGEELDRQIFADGGHAGRNPANVALILKGLVPLRALYVQRGQAVPRPLLHAIDRMLPALRFFLHVDGATALFNGAGAVPVPLVAALVRQDETLGEPVGHMRQSGYQRLSAGGTVLIADAGTAPAAALSGEAHAGTLAFEFSAGRNRFVVNCGAGADREARRMGRQTAAHSTLTIADRSSSRFTRSPSIDRFLGGPIVSGPTRVPTGREDTADGTRLFAAHDGYRRAFCLVHEREIVLSRDGSLIEGTDRLHRAGERPGEAVPEATLRFHLHADVAADESGLGIRLAAGGEVWWFFSDAPARLEDSILFADRAGPRRTRQIVVALEPGAGECGWRFERRR